MNPKGFPYRECTRCVMDTTATGITFDSDGKCNYCVSYLDVSQRKILSSPSTGLDLSTVVKRVKSNGKGKPYDCIIGVSGGVDSSWTLVKAVELGLRPLAVHMDNGWDSELAQSNISTLVQGLGVDLLTHVIEWDEYRQLMQAFFDADVIDVEMLYDNAMLAVNFSAARRYHLRYILSGTNYSTEGMSMPQDWAWYKFDKTNIKSISKHHGGPKLKSYPAIGTLQRVRYLAVNRIDWVSFLDFFDYKKEEALTQLESEFGFRRYPYKHYESIFTRFYQGYLLPEKFGVDKRRLHLATLVASGQMSRSEARLHFSKSAYPAPGDLAADLEFFLKKMRWSRKDLDDYLVRPRREHSLYGSERWVHQLVRRITKG